MMPQVYLPKIENTQFFSSEMGDLMSTFVMEENFH